MNPLRVLFLAVAAVMLIAVAPELTFTQHYFIFPVSLAAAIIAITTICAAGFLSIERHAERITGRALPLARRCLIPVPAILAACGLIKSWNLSFREIGTLQAVEAYRLAFPISLALLPFLLAEKWRDAPRLMARVWQHPPHRSRSSLDHGMSASHARRFIPNE